MVEVTERHSIITQSLRPPESLHETRKAELQKEERRYMKTLRPAYTRQTANPAIDFCCDGCGRTVAFDEEAVHSKGLRKYCKRCSRLE